MSLYCARLTAIVQPSRARQSEHTDVVNVVEVIQAALYLSEG
jgi:hypothetical protein